MEAKPLLLSVGLLCLFLSSACKGDSNARSPGADLDSPIISGPMALSLEDCLALAAEYGAAMTEAQGCDPLAPARQCTLLRAASLACPCVAYVNPRNTDALERARVTKRAWRSGDCASHVYDCPALPCPSPVAGTCVSPASVGGPAATPGVCVNVF